MLPDARFLLLQARPEHAARARELASMRAASGLGAALDAHEVDREPLPAGLRDRFAGIVVGGSPYSVTDPDAAKSTGQRLAEQRLTRLAEHALEVGLPVFFTCFGIGVLTRVLGGLVDRTHPEPVSVARNRLTAAGREDPVAGVLPPEFSALTGHKESAPVPPPGAVLLATNDTSPVQLYRAGTVLASQFHPEPTTRDFVHRATVYAGHGYFAEQELAAVTARLLAARVTAPRLLLRRFVQVHGAAPVRDAPVRQTATAS